MSNTVTIDKLLETLLDEIAPEVEDALNDGIVRKYNVFITEYHLDSNTSVTDMMDRPHSSARLVGPLSLADPIRDMLNICKDKNINEDLFLEEIREYNPETEVIIFWTIVTDKQYSGVSIIYA